MIVCGQCKYYLGGGDWNLCCSKKYDLVHEDSEICELFDKQTECCNVSALVYGFRCSICGYFQMTPKKLEYCPNCYNEVNNL